MKEKLKNKKVIAGIITGIAIVVILVVFIFMNQSSLKLKNKEVTIEYGQQMSIDPKDYLDEDENIINKTTASIKEDVALEQGKDYYPVGEYTLVLTCDKESTEVKIIVRDTTAPEFKDFKDTIETVKDVKPEYAKLYLAEDLSKTEIIVDDSTVKYDTVGEYKATVKAVDEYKNDTSKEITVKVTEPTIKLDKSTSSLYVKETVVLKAEIIGKDKKAIFKSSNADIASVDENGKVTAKKKGTATITASANGKETSCKVTVKNAPSGAKTTTKKDSHGNSVTVVTPPKNNPSVNNSDYVKIKDYIPSLYIDLRYATSNNFTGQIIYDFNDAYLRYGTVKKLAKVQNELLSKGYSLKIWDAYRPFSAQKKLWNVVNDPRYVANPSKGPKSHNLGGTVDITIVKKNGSNIPMPTEFDDFSKKADRNYSDISDKEAINNVKLLENTMYKYGFTGYKNEWWDYSDTVSYSYVDFQPK